MGTCHTGSIVAIMLITNTWSSAHLLWLAQCSFMYVYCSMLSVYCSMLSVYCSMLSVYWLMLNARSTLIAYCSCSCMVLWCCMMFAQCSLYVTQCSSYITHADVHCSIMFIVGCLMPVVCLGMLLMVYTTHCIYYSHCSQTPAPLASYNNLFALLSIRTY